MDTMILIRRCGLLLLVIASTSVGRAAAPASLAGRVFYQSGTTSTVGARVYGAQACVLHADGTYTELYNASWDLTRLTGGWRPPTDGTYTYERMGTDTAVLTLRPPEFAPTQRRLSFVADEHGTIEPAPLVTQTFIFWLGDAKAPAPLTNVSLRAAVSGSTPAIAGFVITGRSSRAVLIRAVGPGLAAFGVTPFLSDPKLSVPNLTAPFDANDNWPTGNVVESIRRVEAATGAFPLPAGSADAAIILPAITPGAYTVHVNSANPAATGEVLIEVYLLP